MVDLTTSAAGEQLLVFAWSPVEWDAPLAHETLVAVFTSVPAPHSGELSLEEAAESGLRTEPWVNQRYLITYRGDGDPPVLWEGYHLLPEIPMPT